MQTDTVSITQFVADNRISMTCSPVDSNPHMEDNYSMDHWKCVFTRPTEKRPTRMTVTFSMGSGHDGDEPKPADVLDCLASDAAAIENARSFEDWCSDYGFDTDSRKAEKTFKATAHAAARLKSFLGEDLFSQLLWHTERM